MALTGDSSIPLVFLHILVAFLLFILMEIFVCVCSVPGSIVIPGRCMEWTEQAYIPSSNSKIHLVYCPWIEDVSVIKLKRTDTTLNLSQKAEYRRQFCMAWAQLPLRKASEEWGPAHRTHAHGHVLPWGIRPALYLGRFETCFLLKLPHPELRQQMFTAYL